VLCVIRTAAAVFILALVSTSSGQKQSISESAQTPAVSGGDCSSLKSKRPKSAWLCGEAHICTGDICGRPTDFDFDHEFDVVLRDAHGNKLDSQTLSYEKPKFCFQGHKDGDYQLAFVLYRKGIPQPARMFPTRYRHNADKPNDVYYMIESVCPEGR